MPHDASALSRLDRASDEGSLAVAIAIVACAGILMLPCLWNGFPLLQWDTGGYLARVYEGTLKESRSTVYGVFLYALQAPNFWPVVVVQSGIAAWVIALMLRAYGLVRPVHLVAITAVLAITTSLPWLSSAISLR